MGDHLSAHWCLLGLRVGHQSAVHLAVRERLRDVAHDRRLCDCDGLWVDCRKMGDSDVANGLRSWGQMHRARGGRSDVSHVLGARLDHTVDGLDDGSV